MVVTRKLMAFDCTYLLNPSIFYQAVTQKSSCSAYFSIFNASPYFAAGIPIVQFPVGEMIHRLRSHQSQIFCGVMVPGVYPAVPHRPSLIPSKASLLTNRNPQGVFHIHFFEKFLIFLKSVYESGTPASY